MASVTYDDLLDQLPASWTDPEWLADPRWDEATAAEMEELWQAEAELDARTELLTGDGWTEPEWLMELVRREETAARWA